MGYIFMTNSVFELLNYRKNKSVSILPYNNDINV